ncbi:MAG: hypothetical protein HY001_00015 [Candidatus Portnoybacteria bacterium]|nr:hypothetical protein [Candidatus Portnoybacteria bacterium]
MAASDVIDVTSTRWTEEEKDYGKVVLEKISHCEDERARLGLMFEPWVGAKKNISTEVVLFNNKGEVYLIQRPSEEEKPDEPYPNQYHTPGVTHNKHDRIPDTFKALEKREFGGVEMRSIAFVGIDEVQDPPRGPYLLLIHATTTDATPVNPKGRWVAIRDIPWDNLVPSHREKILPKALAWWESKLGERIA